MSRRSAIDALASEAGRYALFTGKGGVGKTSASSALALALADAGKRVLIVSTDPASNLDEVLQTELGGVPVRVKGSETLWAANLNPEDAAAAYRESVVGPYRGILPASVVANMEEQLSGACTVEIAAFSEFARLVSVEETTDGFDHVIFDTAPTGHTMRLLTLPSAWTGYIDTNTTGTTCIGPLAGLAQQRASFSRAVELLSDPGTTSLVLVARPDTASLAEAARTSAELLDLGITNQRLVVNGVFSPNGSGDAIAQAFGARVRAALDAMPSELEALPCSEIPLLVESPVGVDGLRAMRAVANRELPPTGPAAEDDLSLPGLGALIDKLACTDSGLIMAMGKGGVGKTSVAAAVAVALAQRGKRVTLSTTDPAAHVATAVGGLLPGLDVERIDPEVEIEAYRKDVLSRAAKDLDAEGLALLEEDLLSPCTEEIAVFTAFARTVDHATDRIVVLDTAPTGHTLLLLDASESYHREVLRNASTTPPALLELLPRLRDEEFTRILVVTLPEQTPVSEALRLERDLARAQIVPWAWVINQSLAYSRTSDPVLRARSRAEFAQVARVIDRSSRVAAVPWVTEEPQGIEALSRFARL